MNTQKDILGQIESQALALALAFALALTVAVLVAMREVRLAHECQASSSARHKQRRGVGIDTKPSFS